MGVFRQRAVTAIVIVIDEVGDGAAAIGEGELSSEAKDFALVLGMQHCVYVGSHGGALDGGDSDPHASVVSVYTESTMTMLPKFIAHIVRLFYFYLARCVRIRKLTLD